MVQCKVVYTVGAKYLSSITGNQEVDKMEWVEIESKGIVDYRFEIPSLCYRKTEIIIVKSQCI